MRETDAYGGDGVRSRRRKMSTCMSGYKYFTVCALVALKVRGACVIRVIIDKVA